jgi:uncharacterized protein YcnI
MTRRFVFGGLILAVVVCSAAPAWAHVTITPDTAQKGASDQEIEFRIPNEETTPTTKVQISIPTDPPLAGVLPQSVPGWTTKVLTTHLDTPIHTDDGDISDVVSEVDWTANSPADGVQPEQFQAFTIIVGALPDTTNEVTFKAIQTYANGDKVSWIETSTPGGPPPDHPAPVLTLTSGSGGSTATTTPTAAAAGSDSTAKTAEDDADTAKTIGIVAIIFAVIALAAVAFSMFRKRPASSDPAKNVQ